MASVQPKKVAALLAAVLHHQAETEQLPCGATSSGPPPVAFEPPQPAWARSGRQDAMADRVLWQRRHSRTW